MKPTAYDIFISYRTSLSKEMAEMLQMLLEQNGFQGRVSFDRDTLKGEYSLELTRRIDFCKDFLLIVHPNAFAQATEEEADFYRELTSLNESQFIDRIRSLQEEHYPVDYLRLEVGRALFLARQGKLNLIPITPQSSKEYSFSSLHLPSDIQAITSYQAVFYSDSNDARFKDILPDLLRMLRSRRRAGHRWLWLLLCAAAVLTGIGAWSLHNIHVRSAKQALMQMESPTGEPICWSADELSLKQMKIVSGILKEMIFVEGGTYRMGTDTEDEWVDALTETPASEVTVEDFWMGQYEVSVGQYCGIMGLRHNASDSTMPMTGVSYDDCLAFAERLSDITCLHFRLPTEEEWEYAARGGARSKGTRFAGSDNAGQVAWHSANSGNRPHRRNDPHGDIRCNELDFFDLSGNVAEWCQTPFLLYTDRNNPNPECLMEDAMVVRGGSYITPIYSLTVTHREPLPRQERLPSVGFRLVIEKTK